MIFTICMICLSEVGEFFFAAGLIASGTYRRIRKTKHTPSDKIPSGVFSTKRKESANTAARRAYGNK